LATTGAAIATAPHTRAAAVRALGHGDFRYHPVPGWGDPGADTPVKNCHGIVCDAEGNQLDLIDDHEVIGSDPYLVFDPPNDGTYRLQIHDILWRHDVQACLQVTPWQEPQSEGIQRTPATIDLDLEKGQYLTITPNTLDSGSPAQLLMDLYGPDDNRVARGGDGDSILQPLRKKIHVSGKYQLRVNDLLRREGLPFDIDISTEAAPFELTTNHLDWYVTEAGKVAKVTFRVIRHDYAGPIKITSPHIVLEDVEIPEGKGHVNAEVKIPDDASEWIAVQFFGTADVDGQSYRAKVDTRESLAKTPLNMIRWPNGVNDRIFFVIKGKEQKTS
ncbi:MAG: hypothetical protein AAF226_12840, partial [Verrucomicrobiota bacterium]